MEDYLNNNLNLCECGCGQEVKNRFVFGHQSRGTNNPAYKNGIVKHSSGYTYIYKPEHPFADINNHVLKHRLVYEEHYNCILLPWIEIHHIIPIKEGGKDEIDNLIPITKSNHRKIHGIKDMSDRFCLLCNSKTYLDKTGVFRWTIYQDGYICNRCACKIYRNPEYITYIIK